MDEPKKRGPGRPRKNETKQKGEYPPWLKQFDFSNMTREQRLEYARMAAAASADARGKKATFKAALEMLLDMPVLEGNPVGEALKPLFPKLTNRDALSIAIMAKAIQEGDIKAFAAIRDTTGELPVQTVNVTSDKDMVIKVETVE